MKKKKMVKVAWDDAYATSAWTALKKAKKHVRPGLFHSIGYLIADKDDRITVAGSIGQGKAGEVLTIPRGCVVEAREIEDGAVIESKEGS